VCLFLLEKKSHGFQMGAQQEQGLRFVLVTPVLPAALPLIMGLMETSTASMGDQLEDMTHLAPALPAILALLVQIAQSAQRVTVELLLMSALLILV
jgi:hypothetical protein